ncbi:hypothetical protein BGZ47_007339 [Haplosporangium gracile]|nr:hypothetical protein BGZ47_007339 [Haplosporangium gracile]
MDAGRLDLATHPFCNDTHPTDIRLTSRYTINNLQKGITCTIHEIDRALYEQGGNKECIDTPVARYLSIGIHESQSLLWERLVMLSKRFWVHPLPHLKEQFSGHKDLQDVTVDQFCLAFNRVQPTFIRVEGDMATHPMHIILRYLRLATGIADRYVPSSLGTKIIFKAGQMSLVL